MFFAAPKAQRNFSDISFSSMGPINFCHYPKKFSFWTPIVKSIIYYKLTTRELEYHSILRFNYLGNKRKDRQHHSYWQNINTNHYTGQLQFHSILHYKIKCDKLWSKTRNLKDKKFDSVILWRKNSRCWWIHNWHSIEELLL